MPRAKSQWFEHVALDSIECPLARTRRRCLTDLTVVSPVAGVGAVARVALGGGAPPRLRALAVVLTRVRVARSVRRR